MTVLSEMPTPAPIHHEDWTITFSPVTLREDLGCYVFPATISKEGATFECVVDAALVQVGAHVTHITERIIPKIEEALAA